MVVFLVLRGKELNLVCEIMSLTCSRTLPRAYLDYTTKAYSLGIWMTVSLGFCIWSSSLMIFSLAKGVSALLSLSINSRAFFSSSSSLDLDCCSRVRLALIAATDCHKPIETKRQNPIQNNNPKGLNRILFIGWYSRGGSRCRIEGRITKASLD